MKKTLKISGIIVFAIAVLIMASSLFSKLYYGRSLRATIAEFYLKFTIQHISGDEMQKRLLERKLTPEISYVYSENLEIKGGVQKTEFQGMQVLLLNPEGGGKKILYLHGGSYLHDPDPHHFKFLKKLIDQSDARVIFPVYPKAPWHDYSKTYDLITKLYQDMSKDADGENEDSESENSEIIIMGDSAGGGLSLGVSQYFATMGLKKPSAVIVLSPWLDLTMENPQIKEFEKVDPWLRQATSVEIAKSWANGTDVKDYRISPTFGTLEGLQNVTIFVGTREILYPDIIAFSEKLKAKNIKTNLFIGEGLNHVYPLFPIPEADEAITSIVEIMGR